MLSTLAADGPAAGVRQGDAGAFHTVFAVRGGRLEVLESAAGTPYEPWLSGRGELFTRAAVDTTTDRAFEVYRWVPTAPGGLTPERVTTDTGEDRVCFDVDADPIT